MALDLNTMAPTFPLCLEMYYPLNITNTTHKILNKLLKEVKMGRMLGTFTKKPISNLRVSPIGLTPKDDGTWRLIANLSHPLGNSFNDFIDPELCRV